MNKWVAIGALTGICIGLILEFIYPEIFGFEAIFNIALRQGTGIPTDVQYISGSVYSVGVLVPVLLGIGGGFIGNFLFKRKK